MPEITSSRLSVNNVVNSNPIDLNITSDQIINLPNGALFMPNDIVFMNASVDLSATSQDDIQVWDGPGRTGNLLFTINNEGRLNSMISPASVLSSSWFPNTIAPGNLGSNVLPLPSTMYLSVGTVAGTPATVDMYIYGYPIH